MASIDYFTKCLPEFLDELRQLVEIETPTGELGQMRRAAEFLEERFRPFGDLEVSQLDGYGPLLRLRRDGGSGRVLLVAHYDTVWPVGSWSDLWLEDNGRIHGPGVYDMKCGLMFILWMLRYIDSNDSGHPDLDILLNPDEEMGSQASRSHITNAARAADMALVLEPTTVDGSLKLARKGSGEYRISIRGRSAHQGAEPERGVNAVVEAAHQILRLRELEDPEVGTTVGPNVIRGGTISNVVPDHAEILVDVRVWNSDGMDRLSQSIADLRPILPGSEITVSGHWNRPPMEVSPGALAIFERAHSVGAAMGEEISWVRWGGSSDANLTAAAGTPTVDGLGAVGAGAHQWVENIDVDTLPVRLALLTDLVVSLDTEPLEMAVRRQETPSASDALGRAGDG